tara:strand:+ start:10703 stop:11035 length:333 start_codon:yes stop_codon:yes gene_type:complete
MRKLLIAFVLFNIGCASEIETIKATGSEKAAKACVGECSDSPQEVVVVECPAGFMEGIYVDEQDLVDTFESIQNYQQCVHLDGKMVTKERLRLSPAPACIECESVVTYLE